MSRWHLLPCLAFAAIASVAAAPAPKPLYRDPVVELQHADGRLSCDRDAPTDIELVPPQ